MDAAQATRQQSRRKRLPTHQRAPELDPRAASGADQSTSPEAAIPSVPLRTATSTPTSAQADNGPAAALYTQHPRAGPANFTTAATVVTVTQTQTGNNANTGGTAGLVSTTPSVPIGIIVGSVVVGVLLAVAVVGVWIWWGKRLKKQGRYGAPVRPSHKNQTSQSSTSRLASRGVATTPGASPRTEKQLQYLQTTPSHGRQASGHSRRPGQPPAPGGVVAAAGVGGQASPVTNKHRSPPGLSPASVTASETPPSAVVGDESSRAPLSAVGKTYAPQRSSPLAAGAERIKPKEKPKVNEWARPITPPLGLTKSGSTEHGNATGGYFTSGAATGSGYSHDEKTATDHSNQLGIPGQAQDTRKDRISVMSAESYYAPESAEGEADYVGMAIGGDDSSPRSEGYPPRQPGGEYYQDGQYQQQHTGWR